MSSCARRIGQNWKMYAIQIRTISSQRVYM